MGEQRRYFPDWTNRFLERRPELEADHNAYLAGGYAEEFGYRAQPGWSRGVPVLEDGLPELCPEWLSQARSMHPGYPLKPRPLTVDLERPGRDRDASTPVDAFASDDRSTREAGEAGATGRHGAFVVVSDLWAERRRADASLRAAILATRVAAALVSLRWTLRRR